MRVSPLIRNLPELDKYNTQSAIALVRQQFDYGHWYERSKFLLRNLLNCQVRTEGGRDGAAVCCACPHASLSLPPHSTSRA